MRHNHMWAHPQSNLFANKRKRQPSHVLVERVTTTLWSAFVFLGHFHSLSLSLTLGGWGDGGRGQRLPGNCLVSWLVKSDISPLQKEPQTPFNYWRNYGEKIMKENLSDLKKSQLFSVSAQPSIKCSIYTPLQETKLSGPSSQVNFLSFPQL